MRPLRHSLKKVIDDNRNSRYDEQKFYGCRGRGGEYYEAVQVLRVRQLWLQEIILDYVEHASQNGQAEIRERPPPL